MFLRDNRGGFLILFEVKITDKEYERYRHLPIDWSLSPITKADLPEEFSEKAVKTVDIFRRKTIGLNFECLIYFDIDNGNIISCNFADKDNPDKVSSDIFSDVLTNMSIASIHNHPIQYFSPPSGKNFEMLGLDFEEYEIIVSKNELWILESKEIILTDEEIMVIRHKTKDFFDSISNDMNIEFKNGYQTIDAIDKLYGDFLLNYLNNNYDNIYLSRRYLDG